MLCLLIGNPDSNVILEVGCQNDLKLTRRKMWDYNLLIKHLWDNKLIQSDEHYLTFLPGAINTGRVFVTLPSCVKKEKRVRSRLRPGKCYLSQVAGASYRFTWVVNVIAGTRYGSQEGTYMEDRHGLCKFKQYFIHLHFLIYCKGPVLPVLQLA